MTEYLPTDASRGLQLQASVVLNTDEGGKLWIVELHSDNEEDPFICSMTSTQLELWIEKLRDLKVMLDHKNAEADEEEAKAEQEEEEKSISTLNNTLNKFMEE